ncbi:MAG: hypothetical protein IT355_18565 [Gemmatimonadaceae bacterium]|nr:hypothetical protein [Gemmatimonadaceae bacterium]
MRRLLRPVLLAATIGLVAPTTARAQVVVQDTQPQPVKKRRGDMMRLTKEDFEGNGSTFVTAIDIIRTLRPRWLNPTMGRMAQAGGDGQPGGGATEIIVYIDGNRQPSLNELITLRAALVLEMRYLDQNRAIQMHGPGHELGVIEVKTTGTPR